MTIKAVIWDIGGVLLRTEDPAPRTELAQRFGMTYKEIDALVFGCETARQATLGEISEGDHWQSVCMQLQVPLEESPSLRDSFFGGDRWDSELINFIHNLRPRYTTAVLSNAWSELRQVLERRQDIIEAFDAIFISAELGLMKPDPRIFQVVVEHLGILPDQAIFIDDFSKNVETARIEGLHAIHFQSTEQVLADLEPLLNEKQEFKP